MGMAVITPISRRIYAKLTQPQTLIVHFTDLPSIIVMFHFGLCPHKYSTAHFDDYSYGNYYTKAIVYPETHPDSLLDRHRPCRNRKSGNADLS
jgi:hypothetical protein